MLRYVGRANPAPGGLIAAGPLVSVTLGLDPNDLSAFQAATGKAPPHPVAVPLMIDTGAVRTCVEDSIAVGLGLVPIRYDQIVGVSGKPEDYPVYRMAAVIQMADKRGQASNAQFTQDIVGVPPPNQSTPHRGLLGRDFLSFFRLNYSGPAATYELIYDPPMNQSDGTLSPAKQLLADAKAKRHRT